MKAEQKYYLILNKTTNKYIEDWNYNTLRFASETKAMNYIENNIDDVDNYEIVCTH